MWDLAWAALERVTAEDVTKHEKLEHIAQLTALIPLLPEDLEAFNRFAVALLGVLSADPTLAGVVSPVLLSAVSHADESSAEAVRVYVTNEVSEGRLASATLLMSTLDDAKVLLDDPRESVREAGVEWLRVQVLNGASDDGRVSAEADAALKKLLAIIRKGQTACCALHAITCIVRARPWLLSNCYASLLGLATKKRPAGISESRWGRTIYVLKQCLHGLVGVSQVDQVTALIKESYYELKRKWEVKSFPVTSKRASGWKRVLKSSDGIAEAIGVKRRRLVDAYGSKAAAPKVGLDKLKQLRKVPTEHTIDFLVTSLRQEPDGGISSLLQVPELDFFDELHGHMVETQEKVVDSRKNIFEGLDVLEAPSAGFRKLMVGMFTKSSSDPRIRTKLQKAGNRVSEAVCGQIEKALTSERKRILFKLKRSVVPPVPILALGDQEKTEASIFVFELFLSKSFEVSSWIDSGSAVKLVTKFVSSLPTTHVFVERTKLFIFNRLNSPDSLGFDLIFRLISMFFTRAIVLDDMEVKAYFNSLVEEVFVLLQERFSGNWELLSRFVKELPCVPKSFKLQISEMLSKATMDVDESAKVEESVDEAQEETETEEVTKEAAAAPIEVVSRAKEYKLGLFLLKEISLAKPEDRLWALEKMLDSSISDDVELQNMAVDVVATQVYPAKPALQSKINEFARTQFTASEDSSEQILLNSLSLYFALSKLNPSLFRRVVDVYISRHCPVSLKSRIFKELEPVVLALGMDSPEMLALIRDIPTGSESLVLFILFTLNSRGTEPPAEMLHSVIRYYEHTDDARFLVPVLPALKRKEIVNALPKLVRLSPNLIKMAIDRLVNVSTEALRPAMSPIKLVVQLHLLAPKRSSRLYPYVKDALLLCYAEPVIKNPQVISAILRELINESRVPPLFTFTMIQTLEMHKGLTQFIVGLLSRMASKRLYERKDLWKGFIDCVFAASPNSYSVLDSIGSKYFRKALDAYPALADGMHLAQLSGSLQLRSSIRNELRARIA